MALRIYEDSLCSGCGQQVSESMDPVLAEFWATFPPAVCHACAALADANDAVKDWKHPHTARHIVGMNAGWEEARSAARRKSAPADQ